MRTQRPAGKLEQLTHAMSRYHWNKVGFGEMRWKNFGKMSTDDEHKVISVEKGTDMSMRLDVLCIRK